MNFLTFFLYYLVVDAVLSLVTFGILYYFRHDLIISLRTRLNKFIDNRIEFNQNVDDFLEEDDEDYEEPKPAMKKALDEEFGLDG